MWKTCVAEEDAVGKDSLQEIVEFLGGALFSDEDVPEPSKRAPHMGRLEGEQNAAGKL